MNANDHAFIQWVIVADKHATTVLQFPQSVGHSGAVVLRNQHTIAATRHFDFWIIRFIRIKHVTHQACAARQRHEFTLETDQTTCRHTVFQTHTAFTIGLHVLQITTAAAKFFHDRALIAFFNVNGQHFVRLMTHTIDFFKHHAWTRHAQLKAFTAHVFNQNSQVQLTTTRHFKHRVIIGLFHTQSNV